MNPELVNFTLERNEMIASKKLNASTGLYSSYICRPSPVQEDGSPNTCNCVNVYITDSAPIKKGTLYTGMGPVDIEYHDTVCSAGQCSIPFTKGAEEKSIFLKTSLIAAGDEIGWDFVECVHKTRCSFTAFCNEMTRIYQTTNIMAGPFMITNTFISWFFCWIAAFKIDFCQEHNPWCENKPPILACNGTHIGVSIRNLNLRMPVMEPDLPHVTLKAQHKRNDQLLIRDASSRKHLKYLCRKYLKKTKEKELIDEELELTRTQEMLAKVLSENKFDEHGNEIQPPQQELYEALLVFTNYWFIPMHKEIVNILARLLFMLSGDAAVSSVAPFPCHDLLEECCADVLNNRLQDGNIHKLKKYTIELAQLLVCGQKYNCAQFAVDFCTCLLRKIRNVHQRNRPAPSAQAKPNTYDPSSGCTYYFTESGEQVCNMPTYYVSGDKKAKNANFDDMPEVDAACSKLFPKISRSGFGYLFSGSAQCMGTAMDFTSLVVEREGKILFLHCTNIAHTCQRTFL